MRVENVKLLEEESIGKRKTNIRNKTYWAITVFISVFMLFSAYSTLVNMAAFKQLGFPEYFRIELIAAKIIGAIALMIPGLPFRIKEWAYAGFGICLISASIAHLFSGDPVIRVIAPAIIFILLIFTSGYLYRVDSVKIHKADIR